MENSRQKSEITNKCSNIRIDRQGKLKIIKQTNKQTENVSRTTLLFLLININISIFKQSKMKKYKENPN